MMELILILVLAGSFILFIALFLYLVGVYNEFRKRERLVHNSWHQMQKFVSLYFNSTKDLPKALSLTDNELNTIKTIEKEYQGLSFNDCPEFLSLLYIQYVNLIKTIRGRLSKKEDETVAEVFTYLDDIKKKIDFSAPFYNNNVDRFNTYHNFLVNRLLAKMMGLKKVYFFSADINPKA